MEITETVHAKDPTDEMILHVLTKYQMHLSARSKERSITYPGIANAMAKQWSKRTKVPPRTGKQPEEAPK